MATPGASSSNGQPRGTPNKVIGELQTGKAQRAPEHCSCPSEPNTSPKLDALRAQRTALGDGGQKTLDEWLPAGGWQKKAQARIDTIKVADAAPDASITSRAASAYLSAQAGTARAVLGFGSRIVTGAVDLAKVIAARNPMNPAANLRNALDAQILAEEMRLGNTCSVCMKQAAKSMGAELVKPITDPWKRGEYTEAATAAILEIGSVAGPLLAKLGNLRSAATAARAAEAAKGGGATKAAETARGSGKIAEAAGVGKTPEVSPARPAAATPQTPATESVKGPGNGLAVSAKSNAKPATGKPAAKPKPTDGDAAKTGKADDVSSGGKAEGDGAPDKTVDPDRTPDAETVPDKSLSQADDAVPRGKTPDSSPPPINETSPPRDPKTQSTDALTCKGDPIDVVTGRVVMRYTDLALPATLPLQLDRVHLSGHAHGRLFGSAWACTWDQRLAITADRIDYIAGDGMVLPFPVPKADERTLARHGPDIDLRRTSAGYAIEQRHGATLWFEASSPTEARLAAISEPGGQRITFEHDGEGRLARVTHSGGYRIDVTTQRDGRITALHLIDADDRRAHPIAHYAYDDRGRLQSHARPGDSAIRFGYDDAGRVNRWSDRRGTWFEYHFDAQGRCERTIGIDGIHSERFDYDAARRITVHTDALGHATAYHHDAQLQVTCVVDALGGVTRTERDDFDRITRIVDPLDRVTRIAYAPPDAQGRRGPIERIVRADGTVQRFEADEQGRVTAVVDADGSRWQRELDALGRPLRTTQPDGHATLFEHRAGQVLVTDALGHVRKIATDERGLVVVATDPLGHATRYVRDAFGRVRLVIDAAGQTTRFAYTAAGRLAEAIAADSARQTWTYDDEGVLAEHVDPLGRRTRHQTGWFDLPAGVTAPDGSTVGYRHDALQQLASVTDALGRTWAYERDALGRVIAETDFNGRTLRYAHDLAGQCIAQTNALGETTQFEHDAMGRVIARIAPDGRRTSFEHDALGRLMAARNDDANVEFRRDAMGRVIEEICNGDAVRSVYDVAGRRVERHITRASGFEDSAAPSASDGFEDGFEDASTSLWQYDANGLPQTLSLQGSEVFQFRHDALGRETERRFTSRGAELRLAQRFDPLGRITHQSALSLRGSQERLLQQRSWQYGPAGQLTQLADGRHGVTRFERDAMGRVTRSSSAQGIERYAYDLAGQVIESARQGAKADAAAAEGTRIYEGTQLRRAGDVSYAYDAQGRVVERRVALPLGAVKRWRYAWDADDHLIELRTPDDERWRYRYDPFGRRIAKQRVQTLRASDGSDVERIADETRFTWDGPNIVRATRIERRFHADGNEADYRRRTTSTTWDWQPGSFRPLAQTVARHERGYTQRARHVLVTDAIGTPQEMVTADGEIAWQAGRTTLWGERSDEESSSFAGAASDCPWGFQGQYRDDESGLAYNWHRYYDPQSGRYQSSDPIQLAGGLDPHGYVGDPTGWVDPWGLACCPVGWSADSEFTTLYHATSAQGASSIRTRGIDLSAGRDNMDFGRGFYTTTDIEQAQKWASRNADGAILQFRVPKTDLASLKNLEFASADGEWQTLVRAQRSGAGLHPYDTVSGPMLGRPREFLRGGSPSAWGQQTSFHTPAGIALLDRYLLP